MVGRTRTARAPLAAGGARPTELATAPLGPAPAAAPPRPTGAPGHALANVSIYPAPTLTAAGGLTAQRAERSPVSPGPPTTAWIVDDEVAPAPGQLRRQAFLAGLRARVHAAADRALAPVGRGSDGCPYIVRLLARVERMAAPAIERLARAHATPTAASALDYLAAVEARIERGVAAWIATGQLPADAPVDAELSLGGADQAASAPLAVARAGRGPGGPPTPLGDRAALRAHLGPGAPLPTTTRAALESGFATDLGAVRVHDGARAHALADRLDAHAVTVGSDIAFSAGAYRPDSNAGAALLAHEVAHTLQQRGASGAIEGLGSPVQEVEADRAARAALTRAHAGGEEQPRWTGGGLRLQRCGKEGTKAEDAGPAPSKQPPPPPRPTVDPDRVALEAVKELSVSDPGKLVSTDSAEVQEAGQKAAAKASFDVARKRLDRRNKQIDEIVTSDPDKLAALARMKSRWAGTILTNATFDPVSGAVSAADETALRAKIADDRTDAAAVGNSGLTDWAKKLGTALGDYLTRRATAAGTRKRIDEEKVEFQRFNDLFLAADVKAALAGTGLGPADLKAMLAKETGDFTNTAIAGLGGKTKGLVSNKANTLGPSFIGLAQMDSGAKTDALKQATKLGLTIADSATDDARTDPARAIKLSACYVRFIADWLKTNLSGTAPTGAALKPFVLAAYNGGMGKVRDAVKAHGKTTYTWNDIAGDETAMAVWTAPKQAEVTSYVQRILATAP